MTFFCKACDSDKIVEIWNGFARIGAIGDLSTTKSSALKCQKCKSIFLKQQDQYRPDFFRSGKYRKDVDGLEEGDFKKYFKKHSETIISNLGNIPIDKILKSNYLDFGCGAGILLRLLSPFIEKGIGIELDKGYHFNEGNISVVGDFESSDNLTTKFDLITSFSVIGQIEDPLDIFRKFKERLNPGGLLLIADINSQDILLSEAMVSYSKVFFRQSYLNYFSSEGLKSIAQKVGLTHLSTKYEQRYGYENYLSFTSTEKKKNNAVIDSNYRLETEKKGMSDYMHLFFINS